MNDIRYPTRQRGRTIPAPNKLSDRSPSQQTAKDRPYTSLLSCNDFSRDASLKGKWPFNRSNPANQLTSQKAAAQSQPKKSTAYSSMDVAPASKRSAPTDRATNGTAMQAETRTITTSSQAGQRRFDELVFGVGSWTEASAVARRKD